MKQKKNAAISILNGSHPGFAKIPGVADDALHAADDVPLSQMSPQGVADAAASQKVLAAGGSLDDAMGAAWKLPETVKAGQVIEVPIASIKFNPEQLVEATKDIAAGSKAIAATPIQVTNSSGIPLMANGYHRLAEALEKGLKMITVKILP